MNMQLPKNSFNAIAAHKEECNVYLIDWNGETINISDELSIKFKDLFDIENDSASFIAFYAATPFPIINDSGPELLSLNDILENSASEHIYVFFTNPSSVKNFFGKRYFVLTSGEGGSFLFYDSKTDRVYESYDVSGVETIEDFPIPRWSSFYDFIESYYGDGVYS